MDVIIDVQIGKMIKVLKYRKKEKPSVSKKWHMFLYGREGL
jgi:hypothetical protein